MVDEMWLTGLLHKGRLLDPTTMPAHLILDMVYIATHYPQIIIHRNMVLIPLFVCLFEIGNAEWS